MNELIHYIFEQGYFKKLKFFKSMFARTTNEYINVVNGGYEVTVNDKKFTIKADTSKALMTQYHKFTLKKDTFVGVNKDLKTNLGIAINNYLFFEFALERVIDTYINKKFNVSYIINELILPDKDRVGVRRFKKCGLVVAYLRDMADLFVISGTLKTMAKPKWIDSFKKKTIKMLEDKYGKGCLKDKHIYLEYEAIMMKEYHEYLKDDPTYGITTDGKIINSALRKKFISVGALETVDPDNRLGIITGSLKEGLPKDKDEFAIIINNLINGSYERGISTKDSGYTSKILIRAMFPYMVLKDTDCKTTKTTKIQVTKNITRTLVGMNYVKGSSVVKITKDNVTSMIGTEINLRVQHHCKSKGATFCGICSGDELSRLKYSVALLASETGGMALYHNLGKFHVTNFKLIDIGLDDLIY